LGRKSRKKIKGLRKRVSADLRERKRNKKMQGVHFLRFSTPRAGVVRRKNRLQPSSEKKREGRTRDMGEREKGSILQSSFL